MSFPGYILYFNIMAVNQYIKVSTLDVDREIHLYEILSMNQSVHEVCGQENPSMNFSIEPKCPRDMWAEKF